MDDKEVIKKSEVLAAEKIEGQIDWRIENFLIWVDLQEKFSPHNSSVYSFVSQRTKKSYKLSLQIFPKGEIYKKGEKEEETGNEDDFAIYLWNENTEAFTVSATIHFAESMQNTFLHVMEPNHGFGYPRFTSVKELTLKKASCLPEGHLNIHCRFTIYIYKEKIPTRSVGLDSVESLKGSMQRLLADASLSDIVIVCGGEKLHCHGIILANRSDVFKTMFCSDRWTEGKKKELLIDDFGLAAVKGMLHYVYAGELPDDDPNLLELIMIADKYNLAGLVSLCEDSLAKELNLDNVIGTTKVAFMINQAEHLRTQCLEYITNNLEPLMEAPNWKEDIASNCRILEAIVKQNCQAMTISSCTPRLQKQKQ